MLIDTEVLFRKSSRGVKGGKKTAKDRSDEKGDDDGVSSTAADGGVGEGDKHGSKGEEMGRGSSSQHKGLDSENHGSKGEEMGRGSSSQHKGLDSENHSDGGVGGGGNGSNHSNIRMGSSSSSSSISASGMGNVVGSTTPSSSTAATTTVASPAATVVSDAAAPIGPQTVSNKTPCDTSSSAMQVSSRQRPDKAFDMKSEPVDDDECPFLTPVTSSSSTTSHIQATSLAYDSAASARLAPPHQSTPLSTDIAPSVADCVKGENLTNDSGYMPLLADAASPIKKAKCKSEDDKNYEKKPLFKPDVAKLESIFEEKDCAVDSGGKPKQECVTDDDVKLEKGRVEMKWEEGDSCSVGESASNMDQGPHSGVIPPGVSSALLDHISYSEEELVGGKSLLLNVYSF
jgi:hypothetical protein